LLYNFFLRVVCYRCSGVGIVLVDEDTEAIKALNIELGTKLMEFYSNEEAISLEKVGFKPTLKTEQIIPFDFCSINLENQEVNNVKEFK